MLTRRTLQSRAQTLINRWLLIVCLSLIGTTTAQERPQSRSDSIETKVKLLQLAYDRGDYDLARSLTESIKDTLIQVQHEKQPPAKSLIEVDSFGATQSLNADWRRWAHGWKYFKAFTIEEELGIARQSEPIEFSIAVRSDQAQSLSRELRVATIQDSKIVEIPCQVHSEIRRGNVRHCQVLMIVSSRAKQKQTYFLLYGNSNAELPDYPSDLKTQGKGYGLDIANAHFTASLSKQTGQLERLRLHREHGLELFAGGEGHGEPPGIDWAHDYVDEGGFQKLRISLWDQCPDYEVIRGPLCTIVRRYGFPHSPVHPVFTPSRLHVTVEYRFYSGLPWFHKIGSMKAVQEFSAEALRDDEWVFSGQSFTDKLWMGSDGKLKIGDVDSEHQEDLWGVGFFHRESKDSFIALYLDHSAEGIPELKHTGAPLMYYRWHGHVWSRYPLPVKRVPAGAVLRQRNAYLSIPFNADTSPAVVETLRRTMTHPLTVSASPVESTADVKPLQSTMRLARPGEADDAPIEKQKLWDALRDCKDAQLYKADINVVELGLVYDIRVRGDVVTLVMATPHAGRARLGYFIDGSISVHPTLSVPIRERLMQIPGVRQVVFEQTENPPWNSNLINDEGRKKLELD